MTTKLEEVLAEEWSADGGGSICVPDVRFDKRQIGLFGERPHEDVRAAVAVLGKRALANALKYEWGASGRCIDCNRHHSEGHLERCEAGKIVAAAKELG